RLAGVARGALERRVRRVDRRHAGVEVVDVHLVVRRRVDDVVGEGDRAGVVDQVHAFVGRTARVVGQVGAIEGEAGGTGHADALGTGVGDVQVAEADRSRRRSQNALGRGGLDRAA